MKKINKFKQQILPLYESEKIRVMTKKWDSIRRTWEVLSDYPKDAVAGHIGTLDVEELEGFQIGEILVPGGDQVGRAVVPHLVVVVPGLAALRRREEGAGVDAEVRRQHHHRELLARASRHCRRTASPLSFALGLPAAIYFSMTLFYLKPKIQVL